jgi:chromosome segregation protein
MSQHEAVLQQLATAGRDPQSLPVVEHALSSEDVVRLERQVFRLRGDLAAIGDVDEQLIAEAKATEERYQQIVGESADLESARADLTTLVADLDRRIAREFGDAVTAISTEFSKLFAAMFGGGAARLVAVTAKVAEGEDAEGELEATGIDIEVQLPKKRASSLDVLSGGERSLVGLAALFALVSVSPPPFLVLDEVDAPLDERNARRFGELLRSFASETQFIIVTHNRATMEAADVLYGVTLEGDGSSKVVSLKIV